MGISRPSCCWVCCGAFLVFSGRVLSFFSSLSPLHLYIFLVLFVGVVSCPVRVFLVPLVAGGAGVCLSVSRYSFILFLFSFTLASG